MFILQRKRTKNDFIPMKWHIHTWRLAGVWNTLSECFIPAILTRQWVVSFTKSMIIRFNNTVPLDERKDGWLNIRWWYIQNEMVIPAIWNYDTVFRVHFALTCKNYSPGYIFKMSWLQSEGNIWTAHDHIKQHFNIWLQSGRVRAPGATTDSKNNNFIHHYKY